MPLLDCLYMLPGGDFLGPRRTIAKEMKTPTYLYAAKIDKSRNQDDLICKPSNKR